MEMKADFNVINYFLKNIPITFAKKPVKWVKCPLFWRQGFSRISNFLVVDGLSFRNLKKPHFTKQREVKSLCT